MFYYSVEKMKKVDLHILMIYVSGLIAVTAMIMYAFVPDGRSDLFRDIAFMGVAFLFGKFTNNFATRRSHENQTKP